MSKLIVCIIVVTLSEGRAFAQNQRVIDSLNWELQNKTGGDRFPFLYELAFQHLDRDNETALQFILEAEAAALLSGDSLWITKSTRVRGQVLYRLQRMEEAISVLHTAMNIAKRNRYFDEEQYAESALGTAYIFTSQLAKALEFNLRSWELGRRNQDDVVHYEYPNNIGVTYYKLGDYHKALKYYFIASQARHLRKEIRANLLVNIALCFSYLGQFDQALIFLRRVRDVCGDACPDETVMHFFFSTGLNHYKSTNLDSAEINFLRSLRLAELLNDQRMISDNIYFLSDVYLDRNSLSDAKPLVDRVLELIQTGHAFPETRLHAYKRLSEFHMKSGRLREAAFYQSKYIELNDSVYSREYTVRLMAKEVEFAQQQNNTKIEAQADALRLNGEILRRQKIVNLLAGALVLIVTVLLVSLFRNYKRNRIANQLLEQKVRERTIELEANRNDLTKTLARQRLLVTRTSAVLLERINTIKGLCFVGRKEIADFGTDQCFTQIDETSQEMHRYVQLAIRDARASIVSNE